MLTIDTFENSGKQGACDCCGEKASALEHSAVRGQITGTGGRTVVGDWTQRFALVLSTDESVKSTLRAPKTRLLLRTLHDTRGVCGRTGLILVTTTQQLARGVLDLTFGVNFASAFTQDLRSRRNRFCVNCTTRYEHRNTNLFANEVEMGLRCNWSILLMRLVVLNWTKNSKYCVRILNILRGRCTRLCICKSKKSLFAALRAHNTWWLRF